MGVFWQPKAVVIDPEVLTTLPKRELISGYAEVIKYGIIYDKKFFYWLNKNVNKLLNNSSTEISKSIKRSVEIKRDFILKDEKDLINKRAMLNFGHTFGHALEKYTKDFGISYFPINV